MSVATVGPQRKGGAASRIPSRLVGLALLAIIVGLVAPPASAEQDELVWGVYGDDGSQSGYDRSAEVGFNTVVSAPYVELLDDVVDSDLRAIVWLGPYDHDSCEFTRDDAWIREYVGNVAGHPGIVAYYLDDEPSSAITAGNIVGL